MSTTDVSTNGSGLQRRDMKLEMDWQPSVEQLAEAFCELDDERQAQFFIECARIASAWPTKHGGASYQWYLVGKHLRTCTCSTEEARTMITDMAGGIGE